MVRERPGLKAGAVWNQSCVLCHNTRHFLSLWGALLGKPCASYQARWWIALLPKSVVGDYKSPIPMLRARRFADRGSFSRRDQRPARRPARRRCARGSRHEPTLRAEQLLELASGARPVTAGARHVLQPRVSSPTGGCRIAGNPARAAAHHPRRVDQPNLARCHQVLFSPLPSPGRRSSLPVARPAAVHHSARRGTCLLGGLQPCLACTIVRSPPHDDPAWLRWPRPPEPTCPSASAYANRQGVRAHSITIPMQAGGLHHCTCAQESGADLYVGRTTGRLATESVRVLRDRRGVRALPRRKAPRSWSRNERWWGKRLRPPTCRRSTEICSSRRCCPLWRGQTPRAGRGDLSCASRRCARPCRWWPSKCESAAPGSHQARRPSTPCRQGLRHRPGSNSGDIITATENAFPKPRHHPKRAVPRRRPRTTNDD